MHPPKASPALPGGVAAKVAGAAGVYFAVVFAFGFGLGVIRTLWLAPRMGTRAAELCELPFMVLVSFLVARRVTRRAALASEAIHPLGVGLLALSLLVSAELLLVLPVRRISLAQYFSERDPVAFAAYLLALVAFALMPLLVSRRRRSSAT